MRQRGAGPRDSGIPAFLANDTPLSVISDKISVDSRRKARIIYLSARNKTLIFFRIRQDDRGTNSPFQGMSVADHRMSKLYRELDSLHPQGPPNIRKGIKESV